VSTGDPSGQPGCEGCPFKDLKDHPLVAELEKLFTGITESLAEEEKKEKATATSAAAPSAKEAAPSAAELDDATTLLKHLIDTQDRDLNDEDEALQAAIDQSIRERSSTSTSTAASVAAPSVSSAKVDDGAPNYDDDADEVYSEHSYSFVEPVKSTSATTAGPFSPPVISAAEKAIQQRNLELEALALLWAKELQLLGDMGFTNTAELIPLLQKHIGAVPPTQLGNEASNSPNAVAAMQRVVATLLQGVAN